ncbi:MAG: hypothetical protein WD716_14240 [Fimbriimonadaceae bacterium]
MDPQAVTSRTFLLCGLALVAGFASAQTYHWHEESDEDGWYMRSDIRAQVIILGNSVWHPRAADLHEYIDLAGGDGSSDPPWSANYLFYTANQEEFNHGDHVGLLTWEEMQFPYLYFCEAEQVWNGEEYAWGIWIGADEKYTATLKHEFLTETPWSGIQLPQGNAQELWRYRADSDNSIVDEVSRIADKQRNHEIVQVIEHYDSPPIGVG